MTNPLLDPKKWFCEKLQLSESAILTEIKKALQGADDGELFCELTLSEALSFDDNKIKDASYSDVAGFGLRAVVNDLTGYAHSSEWSPNALKRAVATVQDVLKGYHFSHNLDAKKTAMSSPPQHTNQHLYDVDNPIDMISFSNKVALLSAMNGYARTSDPKVKQFSASIGMNWQVVMILRADGSVFTDIRPLVRVNMSVMMMDSNGRREMGSYGYGGRGNIIALFEKNQWQSALDEALRQARVNLTAENTPAGETTVVLGPGWPGILLHEAVGHGLEGDFNRKETSAFTGKLGDQVAAKGVTVYDDGTLSDRRGSLNIDDEGSPTQSNVLIEDGILKNYMQDRQNARLMKKSITGNCRRESYAHVPMPRMTNTFMTAGEHDPNEIITSVKNGVYAVNFGGGQVDITNGKFVFSCTESYLIENGKITKPLKGATLIGNGPESLKYISMIGNDLALDTGIGTCGKNGQGVPVGVGQPTIKLDKMVVGGTRAD
ncbi:MAG: metalloprotease TldD [Alphaproteobacteria bacterium]